MRVFVAGATGVIGVRLLPFLVTAGHVVAGMTRSAAKRELIASLGGEPVVCNVFESDALRDAVASFEPDALVHLVTDLPDDPIHVGEFAVANARVRREGTRNLLASAEAADVSTFVAQSVAWELGEDEGAAVAEHERAVLEAGGIVVRYGRLYGPGTYFATRRPPSPRIHIDEAARRTPATLHAPPGVILVSEHDESDRSATS